MADFDPNYVGVNSKMVEVKWKKVDAFSKKVDLNSKMVEVKWKKVDAFSKMVDLISKKVDVNWKKVDRFQKSVEVKWKSPETFLKTVDAFRFPVQSDPVWVQVLPPFRAVPPANAPDFDSAITIVSWIVCLAALAEITIHI